MQSIAATRRATVAGLLAVVSPAAALGQLTRAPIASGPRVRIDVVTRRLTNPWALQVLPDGRYLVTERPGRLRIVAADGTQSSPVSGIPAVAAVGQGGLLDLALAPDFAASRWVYWSFAEPRGSGRNGTSVARGRLIPDGASARLDEVQVIFRQLPDHQGGLHFGSRLAFAPDGRLFVTLGERFQMAYAQDLSRHWGKVVRLEPDGSVPADNPFRGRQDARPEIWSYGHRNPQSAAIHPATGKLWVVEHGPQGGDEVNIAGKGLNYGWPVIGYGIDYSGARIHEATSKPGMEQPVYYWVPSIAPSGMAFYQGDMFRDWQGNLLVGALAGQALHRLVLDGERVIGEEALLKDLGERIRDVRIAPDGAVLVLTDSSDGKLLRLTPAAR